MKKLNPQKVFVQYRDYMEPFGPIENRKYTITHSDITGELFVFIALEYANDQANVLRDEVRMAWETDEKGYVLVGSVLLDGNGVIGDAKIRSKIFYNEMPTALQALRQADRFLFDSAPYLDNTPIYIQFISTNPGMNQIYDYGLIGSYQ